MLESGSRLGHYEVVDAIGKGGMGEVYRASDQKLGREVAIKILPDEFAADAERLARFEREARLLASLNHAGIATLYEVGEDGGVHFIVMELVEGDTLEDRIREGPIPVAEAIRIFTRIAEGLDAAHEKGIIHRDLKPANVKITEDGDVKILDFGLAKAFLPDDEMSPDTSLSPTLTRAKTQAGTILGTASYMSPEQARGKHVDKRSDVWAFGCCLYEALTGQKAFAGDTVTDTLAAIVKSEPDWSALPSNVPLGMRRLLQRSLVKQRRERLRDIGDARWDLVEVEAFDAPSSSSRPSLVPWLVTVVAVGSALAVWWIRPAPDPPRLLQFELDIPAARRPMISPDGSRVVFPQRNANGESLLWVRSLSERDALPLQGSEGGQGAFWSPDSQRVGFFARGALWITDLTGAPPVEVVELDGSLRGATWNTDGVILFATAEGRVLRRVSAAGGAVTEVTALDSARKENSHRFPFFLPDGDRFLYTARSGLGQHSIKVGSLSTGASKDVVAAFSGMAYAEPGYLLYVRDRALLAHRFDLARLEVSGAPSTLVDDTSFTPSIGGAGFSVSTNGVLVYLTGRLGDGGKLAWLDRSGRVLPSPLDEAEREAIQVAVSDDERVAAVGRNDKSTAAMDLWRLDLERGVSTPLTTHPEWDQFPAWSPDGRKLAYKSGDGTLSVLDTETRDAPVRVLDDSVRVSDWSPDGKFIVFSRDRAGGPAEANAADIFAYEVGASTEPVPVIVTAFSEYDGRVSPDGHFLTYVSDETGRPEVWMASFPDGARARRVSRDGGSSPRFGRDGSELFYVSPEGDVISVPIQLGDPAELGSPQVLFAFDSALGTGAFVEWDVLDNGRRFLVVAQGRDQRGVGVMVNWPLAVDDR